MKMRKHKPRWCFMVITTVCITLMSTGTLLAQEAPVKGGTVRGQVTDTTPAQNPIEGATVKIVGHNGQEFTIKTDVNGNYECTGIPTDRYLISAFKDGYQVPSRRPITILSGGTYAVPFKMAKAGNIALPFEGRAKGINNIFSQIVSLLLRVTKSVGMRYDLDETTLKSLHWSVLNSIERTLEQPGGLQMFARAAETGNMALLEVVLSHPGCKAAFSEHLSEAQFEEYLAWTAARRHRAQQAVARRLTVALDNELSLRADQREKVVQVLLDTTDKKAFPNVMEIFGIGSQEARQLAHHKLNI